VNQPPPSFPKRRLVERTTSSNENALREALPRSASELGEPRARMDNARKPSAPLPQPEAPWLLNELGDPDAPPSIDRAMDALSAAAEVAEGRAHTLGRIRPAREKDVQHACSFDASAVRARLDRVMMGESAEDGLDACLQLGLLAPIFPEVHAMIGFGDGEWRHKDVWKHTKQVVWQAVPKLEVRWGALMHDIGKIKTRTFTPDGKVQFLGHAEVGARMFDKMNKRLSLFHDDDSLRETVRFLVLHHLRPNQYDPSWTDSAVRRFARELATHLDDLLCLARADITTKRPEKKRKGLGQIDELQARIAQLAAEDAVIPPLPKGVGDDIMKAFGLRPSRIIGDIKRALEADVESGRVQGHQASEYYVEIVKADPGRYGIPF
jgi:poly(A) polymerase